MSNLRHMPSPVAGDIQLGSGKSPFQQEVTIQPVDCSERGEGLEITNGTSIDIIFKHLDIDGETIGDIKVGSGKKEFVPELRLFG